MLKKLITLWAFWQEQKRTFDSPEELHAYQVQELEAHLRWVGRRSPLYRQWSKQTAHLPALDRLKTLPVIGKAEWLASFNESNTAGLDFKTAQRFASTAEIDRSFQAEYAGYTVGLSSGTSGSRGLFVVSPTEQAQWAGTVLAKLFHEGLPIGQRVAFFLRANSNLYTSVRSKRVSFEYFDTMQSLTPQLERLKEYSPTIIVAPAQVLEFLTQQQLDLSHVRAISVAEVLEPRCAEHLRGHFQSVEQVYQATEGLLATTCQHGRLHLNSENVFFELEPAPGGCVVPIITDFRRKTQPLLRYRLNDVLQMSSTPCTCGRHSPVVDIIHGRQDDMFQLPGRQGEPIHVFADSLSRLVALHLPVTADYRLTQVGNQIMIQTTAATASGEQLLHALKQMLTDWQVDMDQIQFGLHTNVNPFEAEFSRKLRRIRRMT